MNLWCDEDDDDSDDDNNNDKADVVVDDDESINRAHADEQDGTDTPTSTKEHADEPYIVSSTSSQTVIQLPSIGREKFYRYFETERI